MNNQSTNNQNTTNHTALISGILLIAGTCIGAGMLALPVVTGLAGFYPAMLINILCWLFMLCTGLLFFEVTLWMPEGANLLSMAQRFLGPVGKVIGGISFLFLYYCLEVSYLSGGTPLFVTAIQNGLGVQISSNMGYVLFTFVFGLIVFLGAKAVDRVNWVLMFGLVTSYLVLITVGSTEVNTVLLGRQNWGLWLIAAPTLFSAYGYHNIIPTVTFYLKRDVAKIRMAIIIGTSIPFIVYSFWQWMIIGSISEEGIRLAAERGVPINNILEQVTGNRFVGLLAAYFGFFAIVTSLLGVALSMLDFLADGCKVKKEGWNRVLLACAVFLPPAIFAARNPDIFIEAIGYAGGFGEAILNGIFPIAMVWVGRYRMNLPSAFRLPGGRPMLIFLFLCTLLIIALEIEHVWLQLEFPTAEWWPIFRIVT